MTLRLSRCRESNYCLCARPQLAGNSVSDSSTDQIAYHLRTWLHQIGNGGNSVCSCIIKAAIDSCRVGPSNSLGFMQQRQVDRGFGADTSIPSVRPDCELACSPRWPQYDRPVRFRRSRNSDAGNLPRASSPKILLIPKHFNGGHYDGIVASPQAPELDNPSTLPVPARITQILWLRCRVLRHRNCLSDINRSRQRYCSLRSLIDSSSE